MPSTVRRVSGCPGDFDRDVVPQSDVVTVSPLCELDLFEVRDYLIETAKLGGQTIVIARPSSLDQTSKKNGKTYLSLISCHVKNIDDSSATADIVTATDQAVGNLVAARLRTRFPSFEFMGEETYTPGTMITSKPTFIVDPIDGTSNFVHGFPAVCISMGLVVDKRSTVGVVYNPALDELYAGIQGHGADTQLTGGEKRKVPLNPSPLRGLGPGMIGIEWGSDREGVNFDLNLKVFTTLARTDATGGRFVNSLRCTGSAAITICRIAAGQQDTFWECGYWAWDVAAGWCILNEAGGMIVDEHPGNWYPPIDNRGYLAVRPASSGQKEIAAEFWDIIGSDRSTYGPS